jgi:hypothetical protein
MTKKKSASNDIPVHIPDKRWQHVPRIPIRVVAVDPGEAWCGIARLDVEACFDRNGGVDGIAFTLDARVVHATPRPMHRVVAECLWPLPAPRPFVSALVAEDYRVRPVGHASFHGGGTLRLLGALEYAAHASQRMAWHLYPPREPDKDLPLLSNGALDGWVAQWHASKDKRWHHARSAWRVLLMHLMQVHPSALHYLREPELHPSMTLRKATFPIMEPSAQDLLAPEARMVLRSNPLKPRNLGEGVAD